MASEKNSINELMRYLTVAVAFCLGFITDVIGAPRATLTVAGNTVEGSFVRLVCLINDYNNDEFASIYKLTSQSERPGSPVVRCLPRSCNPRSASRTRYTYYRDNISMYINITSLNRDEDQGWWRCSLGYTSPHVEDVYYLALYRSPVGIFIIDAAESIDLTLSNASVTCETINCTYPAPVITWYFTDGSKRILYYNDSHIVRNNTTCTGRDAKYRQTITFGKYTESPYAYHNRLTLQCGLSHLTLPEEVFSEKQVTLTFAGKPKGLHITGGGIHAANSTVILVCSVSADPEPTITWYRKGDNQPLQSGVGTKSRLIFANIQCHQMDRYICFAENDIGKSEGSADVFVQCPPMESVPHEKNIYSVLGNKLILEIRCISFRRPTFTWYNPKGNKIVTDGIHMQDDTASSSTLTITNLQMYGIYKVNVSNDVGPDPVFEFHVKDTHHVENGNNIGLIFGSTIGVAGIVTVILIAIIYHTYQKRNGGTEVESSTPTDSATTDGRQPAENTERGNANLEERGHTDGTDSQELPNNRNAHEENNCSDESTSDTESADSSREEVTRL